MKAWLFRAGGDSFQPCGVLPSAVTVTQGPGLFKRYAAGYREDPAVTRLGVVLLPQLPPERLASLARAADEAGLEELWLWEDCFRESGIATAAAALALTAHARVGAGLYPSPCATWR